MRRAAFGWWVFLWVLLGFSRAAAGQRGETCGEISAEGECQEGEQAVYCTAPGPDAGTAPLARLPCEDLEVDERGNTVEGRCEMLDGYGAWCVLPEDAPCAGFDDDGALYSFACGDTGASLEDDAACDLADGCVRGLGPCDPEDPGPARCLDERLTLACSAFGQYVTLRCSDPIVGGRCVDGACVVGEGERCAPEGPVVCGPQLVCAFATATRSGTCVPEGTPLDAGPLDAGARDIDEDLQPPFAIHCQSAGGGGARPRVSPSLFALLAALAALAARPRGTRAARTLDEC